MPKNNTPEKRYPLELKERAVKMVLELRREDPGDVGVIPRVARQLGVGADSLRTWVKRVEIDSGIGPGMSSVEHAEVVALKKEVRELRRANAILQAAASFFGAELDRRSLK